MTWQTKVVAFVDTFNLYIYHAQYCFAHEVSSLCHARKMLKLVLSKPI